MKDFKKYSILYSLLIICNSFLLAQQVISKHYNVNDGLPSSECYWVMQDSKHFLWIATDAGVVKYDGYKFITYNSKKGLPDNTVFKIHEDNNGRIWFSTYSGKMAYYNHTTDSIYEIPCNNRISEIIKVLPLDFCFDQKDTLFVSIREGGYVKVIPPLYKNFVHYHLPHYSYFIKEIDKSNFIYGVDINNKGLNSDTTLPFQYTLYNSKKTPAFYPNSISYYFSCFSSIKINPNNYLFTHGQTIYKITEKSLTPIINEYIKDKGIISLFKNSHQNRRNGQKEWYLF